MAARRRLTLLPEGVADQLAKVGRMVDDSPHHGVPVFADWLLERGSPWGEWLMAPVDPREEARADALQTLLAPELLGPLRGLDVSWEFGLLRYVSLKARSRLSQAALAWPLWAGVWDIRVEEPAAPRWRRLFDAGVLRSLGGFDAWSRADVERAASRGADVAIIRAHGDEAIKAVADARLSAFPNLVELTVNGAVPERFVEMLSHHAGPPKLNLLRIHGAVDLERFSRALTTCSTVRFCFVLTGSERIRFLQGRRALVSPPHEDPDRLRYQLRHMKTVLFLDR